jgi:hypothetical protein
LPPQVLKLAKLVDELRGGGSFAITRLTVLKTLCREPKVAQRFVIWAVRFVSAGLGSTKPSPHTGAPLSSPN